MSFDDKSEDDSNSGFICYKSWLIKGYVFIEGLKPFEAIYHMSNQQLKDHNEGAKESIWF
jgi:hypothetical protein